MRTMLGIVSILLLLLAPQAFGSSGVVTIGIESNGTYTITCRSRLTFV